MNILSNALSYFVYHVDDVQIWDFLTALAGFFFAFFSIAFFESFLTASIENVLYFSYST